MTRYRVLSFGDPLGSWQATEELAEQVAIEADQASRDPHTGFVYLGIGVTIEKDDGEKPEMSPDMALWAQALAILRLHMFGAEDYIEAKLVTASGDRETEAMWRLIGKRITMVREAAKKDKRSE